MSDTGPPTVKTPCSVVESNGEQGDLVHRNDSLSLVFFEGLNTAIYNETSKDVE